MVEEMEKGHFDNKAGVGNPFEEPFDFGLVNPTFLSQSVGVISFQRPITVLQTDSINSVLQCLRDNRVGCVLVVDEMGRLSGLISERDFISRIWGSKIDFNSAKVADFMTIDPVAEPPTITIAYALNLMSHGGFRHLPLIDQERIPIGIVSVKDVVDYIVDSYTDALLNFEVSED